MVGDSLGYRDHAEVACGVLGYGGCGVVGVVTGVVVHFYSHEGLPMTGILTGTDYEEIEVTTPDGEKYYMEDGWLDHRHEEPE